MNNNKTFLLSALTITLMSSLHASAADRKLLNEDAPTMARFSQAGPIILNADPAQLVGLAASNTLQVKKNFTLANGDSTGDSASKSPQRFM